MTEPTAPAAVPAWYAQAEQEYDRAGADGAPAEIRRRVDEVNRTLARLGITPLVPARAGYEVLPAVLLEADAEEQLWAVDATHDGRQVVLEVQDWEYQDSPVLRGPALTGRAQVVHAHRYGAPALTRDLEAEALALADRLEADFDADLDAETYALASQVRALTLAVLHTARAVCRI
ncbi:hypothetical protein AB0O31_32985 [Kitasatospora cineracea]|uniref:hypothetical protein n=1 Tax=Kitasatospora cineracea TaxID=88074 RepID=UPI00343B0E27